MHFVAKENVCTLWNPLLMCKLENLNESVLLFLSVSSKNPRASLMANLSKRWRIVPVVRIYDDGARRDKAGEPLSHLRRPKPAILSGSAVPVATFY